MLTILCFAATLVGTLSNSSDLHGADAVILLQTSVNLSNQRATALAAVAANSTVGAVIGDAAGLEATDFSMKKVVAEFVAMTLFVTIGCGSAMAIAKEPGSAWVLQVAFVFGLAITVLAYSLGRYSGGQINCAVTLALWVDGGLSFVQAIGNFIGQMLGSVLGALFLCVIFPQGADRTGGLGSNGISEGFGYLGVLVAEFLMTFLLVITVLESSFVAAPASGIAVIPIGFAVFLAHCVLIPIDGCSINPTRSFGPALVASFRNGKADTMRDMWVFWVGPLLGALAATGVHNLMTL